MNDVLIPSPVPSRRGLMVEFKGEKYYCYPHSNYRHVRVYFHNRRGKCLHIAIWEHYNGPKPRGLAIHHIDGDTFNNEVSNLQCLTLSEHIRLHNAERDCASVNLPQSRKALAEFHRSPEGRRIAGLRSKKYWENAHKSEGRDATCCVCGSAFKTICTKPVRFCSTKCSRRYHNGKKSGRDVRSSRLGVLGVRA